MKNKKLLIIFLTIFPLIAAVPKYKPFPESDIKIEFNTIGPYAKYQNDPVINFSVVNPTTKATTIYEKFTFGNSDTPIGKTVTKANHFIYAGETYASSVTLPTSMFLDDGGMSILCEVYLSTEKRCSFSRMTIYPIKSETINPLVTKTYESKVVGLTLKSSLVESKEKISFIDFNDYFDSTTYYKLDVDQFRIDWSYANGYSFNYTSANLIIDGYQEYFPGLDYFLGICRIPLSLSKYSDGYGLIFKNQLYVEPKTLIMSTSPKTGYRATKHFYLPINKKDELKNIPITFEINNAGINRNKIAWTTNLLAYNSLIGNCQESEYCVVGDIKR